MREEHRRAFLLRVEPVLERTGAQWAPWSSLSLQQRRIALERGLLTSQQSLAEDLILAIPEGENEALLALGQDHFAFLGLAGGWNWALALRRALRLWNAMKMDFEWAHSPKYGWIGPSPKAWGPALRLSVLIQVPALEESGGIYELLELAEERRLSLRGHTSGGNRSLADVYEVSSGPTTDREVLDLVEELDSFLDQAEALERAAGERLLKTSRWTICDRVHRSLGILERACLLDEEESLELLSRLRLGLNLGILESVALQQINRLYYGVRTAHLSLQLAEELPPLEEGRKRAEFVRQELKKGRDDGV